MEEEVERTPTAGGMCLFGGAGLVCGLTAFYLGIDSIRGLFAALGSGMSFFLMLVQYPNTHIGAGPEGIREYKAWRLGGWTLWERERKVRWDDVTVIHAEFGMPPKAHLAVEGQFETNGTPQHDMFEMPISARPEVGPATGGGDEVVAYVAEHAPRARLTPAVIGYLKKRDLYDPARHPPEEECGTALEGSSPSSS
jgi:hypothetical protein